MTKDLWYIVRIPTRTSNFKTMTNLFNLRFDRARANGNALSRISHKKNEYETQKPYRVWVLTGYSSWRKNDSV